MRKTERILLMLLLLAFLAGLFFFVGLYGGLYQRTPFVIKAGEGLVLTFTICLLAWYGVAKVSPGRPE